MRELVGGLAESDSSGEAAGPPRRAHNCAPAAALAQRRREARPRGGEDREGREG